MEVNEDGATAAAATGTLSAVTRTTTRAYHGKPTAKACRKQHALLFTEWLTGCCLASNFHTKVQYNFLPIPVAAPSKAWV